MVLSADALMKILAAGGSITIDGSEYPLDALLRIVMAAKSCKARIHIKKADRYPVDVLVRIASAGKRYVSFEF